MRTHRGKILVAVLIVLIAGAVAYFQFFNGGNATGTNKQGTPTARPSAQPSNFPVIDNPPPITQQEADELEQALNSSSVSTQKLALAHEGRPSHNKLSNFGGTLTLDAKTFKNNKVSGYVRGTVKTSGGTVHYAVYLVYEKGAREPNGKWLVRETIKEQQ